MLTHDNSDRDIDIDSENADHWALISTSTSTHGDRLRHVGYFPASTFNLATPVRLQLATPVRWWLYGFNSNGMGSTTIILVWQWDTGSMTTIHVRQWPYEFGNDNAGLGMAYGFDDDHFLLSWHKEKGRIYIHITYFNIHCFYHKMLCRTSLTANASPQGLIIGDVSYK